MAGGVLLGLTQKVVNVQWGRPVIVVFVSGTVLAAQPEASYAPVKNKAKLLKQFAAPYDADGFMPGFPCSVYKASASAGEFLKSTVPSLPDGQPMWLTVCVFAMTGEGDDREKNSVDRAVEGVKKIVPAINFIENEPATANLPTDMSPPGLLWLVETGSMSSGQLLTWKMRFGEHRNESGSDLPPNAMVQSYPLEKYSGPLGAETVKYTGYKIYGYRLDKRGTDIVYGEKIATASGPRQDIDPAWNQSISNRGGFTGIPTQDPPPLIDTDLRTPE